MNARRAQLLVHVLGLVALALVAWLARDLRLARAPGMVMDAAGLAALPDTLDGPVDIGDHRALVPDHLVDDPDGAYHLRRVEH